MAPTPWPIRQWAWFLVAHIALGLVLFEWREAATPHAWLTLALAVWVVTSRKRAVDVAVVAAYIVGAEVLWRMRGAMTFWEMGKYAVAAVLLMSLVRIGARAALVAPIAYFALLLPSVSLTVTNSVDLAEVRDRLSYDLSGPFALATCVCFFRQVTLTRKDFAHLAIAAIAPIVSVATITVLATYTATEVVFTAQSSNASTSAGFGPNQVSAVLGLGALLCFLLLATETNIRRAFRLVVFAILVLCVVQSAMTFSRGGVYMAGAAIGGAAVCFFGHRLVRGRAVLVLTAAIIAFMLIWPALIGMTDGMLVQRFEDTQTTGRAELAMSDLELFAEHPLLGVGPGGGMQARGVRAQTPYTTAAHTEWTRVLAEHGVLGLLSIGVLSLIMASNVRFASGPIARGIIVALLIWSGAFLFGVAMRLVAPAFLIGVTCATLRDQPPDAHSRGPLRTRRRMVA